jgi:hypothetical protein
MLRAVEFDRHLLLGGYLERPARARGSGPPGNRAAGARLGQGFKGSAGAYRGRARLRPARELVVSSSPACRR